MTREEALLQLQNSEYWQELIKKYAGYMQVEVRTKKGLVFSFEFKQVDDEWIEITN